MSVAIQCAPFFLLFLGFAAAAYIAIKYNVRTYVLQKTIHELAKSRGQEWAMWGDLGKMTAFVFHPQALELPEGHDDLRIANQALLDHRRRIVRTALLAGACFVLGVVLFAATKAALFVLEVR